MRNLINWAKEYPALVLFIDGLNQTEIKSMHIACEKDLNLLKKSDNPNLIKLANDRKLELKYLTTKLSDLKEKIDNDQYRLLQDFVNHLFAAKKGFCTLDANGWSERLDEAHVPWYIQNTVSGFANDFENQQKYLTTLLKTKNIRLVKSLKTKFGDMVLLDIKYRFVSIIKKIDNNENRFVEDLSVCDIPYTAGYMENSTHEDIHFVNCGALGAYIDIGEFVSGDTFSELKKELSCEFSDYAHKVIRKEHATLLSNDEIDAVFNNLVVEV